jgi:putative copper resistance protein D
MNETLALLIRVVSIALFDWSLAMVCGLLLAAHWLRNLHLRTEGSTNAFKIGSDVKFFAVLMMFALGLQFYVLVATMSNQPGLIDVIKSAPAVATTHAGKVLLYTFGAATLLALISSFNGQVELAGRWTWAVLVALVIVILAFRAATGHAASEGDFNIAEGLQFLHLSGMALWTGAVLVSGLFVAKRLAAASSRIDATYLMALSRISTYSVAVVLLSGAYKGWIGLDRQVSGIVHTAWGRILLFKLALGTC